MTIRERCREIRESLDLRVVITEWYGHELDKNGRGTCPFCEGSSKTKFRIVDGKGFVSCNDCSASWYRPWRIRAM